MTMRHILQLTHMKRSKGSVSVGISSALLGLLLSNVAMAQANSPVAPLQESTQAKVSSKKSSKPISVNGIAVVVGDEAITTLELNERISSIERSLKAQGTTPPERAEIQKQILERMIIDRLQIQLAKEQGMRVDDVMLDRSLQRMAESNKMSLQELRNQVEREGTPFARFREDIREEILMQRVREREVDSKIQVSETEIDNYLASEAIAPSKNQEINLAHIMIRIPENATADVIAQRQARAMEAHKRLRIGEDFAKLAATYSDSVEAMKGGEVGYREQDKIPPIFMDAVNKISFVGGYTDVIRSPNGFHILKLLGKRDVVPPVDAKSQQSNVRHILMRPTPAMTAAQVKATLLELKKKIVSKSATFEELAKTNSIDTSAAKGGELGWVYPGDTSPEFETAMNALAINDVSDPVETQLGFHIIQVTERKQTEDSIEKKRSEARQAVRARKADEALQSWLRQLRDRGYVEFRTENK